MIENFYPKKEEVKEPSLKQNENRIDSIEVDNFLNEFNPDFNIICNLVDKLNNDLNKEERKNILNELIDYVEKTIGISTYFLNYKKENLKINNSPIDLFVINEIHTLKVNLSSIKGFSELSTDDDEFQEELESYFITIKRAVEGSKELINKLENIHEYEVNLSEVSLKYLISSSISSLNVSAKEKNISIKNEINENISTNTDPDIIESSLLNLISNAIKFTQQGGNITVSINKDNKFIYINVKDDGIGINKEKQKDFFNNLGVTTMGTKNEVGTGIGLYAISNILKEVKGEISVESEGEGKGSTFIITLPIENNNYEPKK